MNRAQYGEPAVPFLPSHVQVTKQQRHLKGKAIINFAELSGGEALKGLFCSPGLMAPGGGAEGPAVAFVVLMEYTVLLCPGAHAPCIKVKFWVSKKSRYIFELPNWKSHYDCLSRSLAC